MMAASWSTIYWMEPRLGWSMTRSGRIASDFPRTNVVMATTVAMVDIAVLCCLKILTTSASHCKTIDVVDKDVVN